MTQLRASSADLYAKRDQYMNIREGLLNQATFIKKLNRVSWSQVFSVVSDELPQNIGLTSFEFRDGGSATFSGEALTVETIAELMRSIDSSAILTNPQFDFLREKMEGEQKIFTFGIFAQLKSNEDMTKKAGADHE
jgi:Tfp pilus assembly protein PilN